MLDERDPVNLDVVDLRAELDRFGFLAPDDRANVRFIHAHDPVAYFLTGEQRFLLFQHSSNDGETLSKTGGKRQAFSRLGE